VVSTPREEEVETPGRPAAGFDLARVEVLLGDRDDQTAPFACTLCTHSSLHVVFVLHDTFIYIYIYIYMDLSD
jgi:hypothetical protein